MIRTAQTRIIGTALRPELWLTEVPIGTRRREVEIEELQSSEVHLIRAGPLHISFVGTTMSDGIAVRDYIHAAAQLRAGTDYSNYPITLPARPANVVAAELP